MDEHYYLRKNFAVSVAGIEGVEKFEPKMETQKYGIKYREVDIGSKIRVDMRSGKYHYIYKEDTAVSLEQTFAELVNLIK